MYHEIKSCIFPLFWLLRFLFFFSKLHCLPLSCMHNRFIHRTLLQVSGSVFNFPLWFNKRHVIIASLWSSPRHFNFLSCGPLEQLSLPPIYKIRMKPAQMVLFYLKKKSFLIKICYITICKVICWLSNASGQNVFVFVFVYKSLILLILIWTSSSVIKAGSIAMALYNHIGCSGLTQFIYGLCRR